MDKSRLVERKDYAAGVGLTFPIWNGDEDRRREQGAKARSEFQEEELRAARLAFSVHFKNLKDEYVTQRRALVELERNLSRVDQTIELAAKRYHTLQGTLVDVREAFRQLHDIGRKQLDTGHDVASAALQLGLIKE